jgi:SOS-response transcriptional repressor LexA
VSCPALTPIQIKILSFIQKYQQLWGATPRYGEIALDCGLGSDSAVGYQIRRLAKLGIVHKPARLHRAIRLIVIPVAGPG